MLCKVFMPQVDISMFSSIVVALGVFGIVIYLFWLNFIHKDFMKNHNMPYYSTNKSFQFICLLFKKSV